LSLTKYIFNIQLYILTYSMVQSPSWEANWFEASQEIPRILWNCTSTLVGEYDVSEPLIRKPAIGHDPECVHFPPPADFTRYFPQISPYVQGTYYQCVTLCFPVPCNVRTQAEETVDQWEYKKCVTSRGWRDIWASIISYSLSISDCNTLVHEVNICFTAFLKKRPMEKAVNSV